ncbi:TRAP transporter small permease [Pusillimonas sp.]|uniref:TRAP transporter small permease n=1 Tax=Pusillimonas sp. TaxID=3040095 RepID=UPI0029AB786B|nr:TRAP transporter small permease [Pusillimonas sp.]MDX3895262.1 TRAP transporter small permease [Pusillimonas sp.]
MNHNNKTPGNFLSRSMTFCLGGCAALFLMVMMVLTFIDVIGRYFFHSPVNGVYELTEVLLAFVVFFALPLVTLENGHITVSLFDPWFKGVGRKIKELLISLMMVFVQAVMTWRLGLQARDLVSYGDASMFLQIPYGWVACAMAAMAAISTLFSLYLVLTNILQFNNNNGGAIQ